MAQMNSLLVSWNFDTVTGSDGNGEFLVKDVSNNYYGLATGLPPSSSDFVFKEDVKTNRKVYIESLEGSDTIRVLNEDDDKINLLSKPASTQLIIENSFYQIISDEILNIFSSIDSYSFKFMESSNKYSFEYNDLNATKHDFFSKVIDKPNLEKYLEFYKWIDSSLGYMLDQIKPENSRTQNGLKNTIESHILERNKFDHKLPLTVNAKNLFSSGISVTGKNTLNKSNITDEFTDNIEDIVSVENIKNKNFKVKHEYFQTAGKKINSRFNKENKTVFRTVFSSVDGKSDREKDYSEEYSVYNDLNQRAHDLKQIYNLSQSKTTGIQGTSSFNDFEDNNYISRNIPYKEERYHNTGSVNYIRIPEEDVLFRRHTNLLIDENRNTYVDSRDIVEPPMQHTIPLKQDLKIITALDNVKTYSPYSTEVDLFSTRNTKKGYIQPRVKDGLEPIDTSITFYEKSTKQKPEYFDFLNLEKLEVIYPRTDLVGLAQIRLRSRFEEEKGYFESASLTSVELKSYSPNKIPYWTENSYNNSSGKIRYFWRDNQSDRLRTNGLESSLYNEYPIGSFNSYNYANVIETVSHAYKNYHERNQHSSIYSMDARVDYTFTNDLQQEQAAYQPILSCSNEVYGELVPYSHFNLFYLANTFKHISGLIDYSAYTSFDLEDYLIPDLITTPPKPSFTHHIFMSSDNLQIIRDSQNLSFDLEFPNLVRDSDNKWSFDYSGSIVSRVLNKSYQVDLDCRIKPWYDTYEDFRANIKHKSQEHSIVPEFIVSRYEQVIKDQYVELADVKTVVKKVKVLVPGDPNAANVWERASRTEEKEITDTVTKPYYLTINGGERYDQIRQQDFKVDLKKFIDENSNKIKFKLNAIKKLLPYNGFYPQQRTAQIASIFSDTYLHDTGYVSDKDKITTNHDGDNASGVTAEADRDISRTLATTQPLFMPGILFNTIKAGIAMPWPTNVQLLDGFKEDCSASLYSDFEAKHAEYDIYSVKDLTTKLPFETIINPEWYYKSYLTRGLDGFTDYNSFGLENVYLPYLDPTHHSSEIDLTDFKGDLLAPIKWTRRAELSTLLGHMSLADKRLYDSAINNFLAETANFFLKDGELVNFASNPDKEIYVVSGTTYSMDVVLRQSPKFSMFNKPKDGAYAYIHSASLFGPPVVGINGVPMSHLFFDSYMPYAPPYFQSGSISGSESRVSFYYKADETKQIETKDLIKNIKIAYNSGSSESDKAYFRKSNVIDCINFDLMSGSSWIIQTKFEAPLLNFDNCSYVTGNIMYWRDPEYTTEGSGESGGSGDSGETSESEESGYYINRG